MRTKLTFVFIFAIVFSAACNKSKPAASFDAITLFEVIEHLKEPLPLLRECHRVLKSNGLLFVTADYWDPKITTSSANHAFGRAWHIFSKEEIERFLFIAEKVGFHLVERTLA